MALDILVIDDEKDIREMISDVLKSEGFSARAVPDSMAAFDAIAEKVPSALILDIWLQGSKLDGIGILEIIKKRYPLMPVVVISGHGTIETAINSIKMGAYDYIEKPFSHEKLIIVLKRAIEHSKLRKENLDFRSKIPDKSELNGTSSATIKLKAEVDKISPNSSRVLLQGEPGVGKELIARLIHKQSKRATGPFVIFCPTGMNNDRMKQELFGSLIPQKQENGIVVKKSSLLESAHNGTLYIDGIDDLSVNVQQQLLKFIYDQNFEKPGTNKVIKLDVRIISSTSRDIENEIAMGRFRQDLYHRLNIVSLHIPALRERREDIKILAELFMKQLVRFSGLKERYFDQDAMDLLKAYTWPGNVRQLRNVVEWCMIMHPLNESSNNVITADMLPPEVLSNTANFMRSGEIYDKSSDMMAMPLREARELFEKQYLVAQMAKFNNNISRTSYFVGMERSALHRKLKILKIHNNSDKNMDECENESIDALS